MHQLSEGCGTRLTNPNYSETSKLVYPCYVSFAWVTRPERPKGLKDEVKGPEGPPARSWAPEETLDFEYNV